MIDMIGGGLLGSIFGGLFRLAPELLKWLDREGERRHELAMFRLQTDLEKMRGEYRLEHRYVDHGIAQLEAINSAFEQQGKADAKAWKWVASLSALVRPGVTWLLFSMYAIFKLVTISYAMDSNAIWYQVIQESWNSDDFTMLMMILTFWFVGRPIERRNNPNL